MSDIKFNCPACSQSLEAPTEMAGQSIDCPTCKKPMEIPFPRPPATGEHVPRPPESRPANQRPAGRKLYTRPPSPSASAKPPQTKTSSPGLVFAVVLLTLLCLGLTGGMYYLLSEKKASDQVRGTPVAPTKENVSLARRNLDRQTLADKVLPDITVDGEVFVVTKGGQNIKLGLVEVVLIPMDTLNPHLHARRTEMTNAFARLDPQIEAAEAEAKRLEQEQRALYQPYLSDILNREKERAYRTAQEATSKAQKKASELSEEKWSFTSGAFYFDSLPSPLRGTKTNSDGRFRLLVPASGNYAIAAAASRHVMDDVEQYYWLLRIEAKAGNSQTIMLSNDNMTSSGSVESLIRTL